MTITTLKIGRIPGTVRFKESQYHQDLHFISLRNSELCLSLCFPLDWLPTGTGLASPRVSAAWAHLGVNSQALGSVIFPFLYQMSATCTETGGSQFPQPHESSSGNRWISNRERGNLILQGSRWHSPTHPAAPCSLWWKRHASILQVVKVKEPDLFLIS